MVVMKFGGKSLDSLVKVNNICMYIKERSQVEKVVVVVSAIGDTTNRLIALAKQYGNANPRELDALLATGEIQSASLFCLALQRCGVQAQSLNATQIPIRTTGHHLNSQIDIVEIGKIQKLCDEDIIPIITGYQGINEQGELTTLGRGGSDTTAVALGAALNCKVELYSDFEGIFTGDPRRGSYKKLKSIDYDSLLLYSQSGAKVVSEAAAELAKRKKVKLECKGSLSPDIQGTIINSSHCAFKAINVNDNEISLIYNNCNPSRVKLDKILKNFKLFHLSINNNRFKLLTRQSDTKLVEQQLAQEFNLLEQ